MRKDERRSRFGALSLVLFLSIGATACGDCGKTPTPATTDAATAPPPPAPTSSMTGKRPSTTSPEIALHNLNSDIRDRLERKDARSAEKLRLISLLLERASFLGKIADLELADKISREALDGVPQADAGRADASTGASDGDLHFARALVHSAVHRFEPALVELDVASASGVASARVARARAAVYIARGQYDEALTQQLPDFEARDSSLIGTAAVLAGKMQKSTESERLFELARERFLDVAPFPLASMDFQRGQLFELAGDDAKGRLWFAEAIDILPPYAHAAVHLAPGEPALDAIARLEAIRKTSDDPEVLASLAGAHKRAGHGDDAKKIAAEAAARYDAVVAQYPEAFSDHAARFWLGAGNDPKKALALAKSNAGNRPTEEALDLWMATGAGAKSNDDICAAEKAMAKLKYLSERGKRTASAASAKCPTSADPPKTDAGR